MDKVCEYNVRMRVMDHMTDGFITSLMWRPMRGTKVWLRAISGMDREGVTSHTPSDRRAASNTPSDRRAASNTPSDRRAASHTPSDRRAASNTPSEKNTVGQNLMKYASCWLHLYFSSHIEEYFLSK